MNIPISNRNKALIIVDVQSVFLNKDNRHVLSTISDIIKFVPYHVYVNAVFYANKKSIWKQQTNWSVPKEKAKTHNSIQNLLDKKENVINIIKQTKSVFKGDLFLPETLEFGDSLSDTLFLNGIKEVHIIGLDTNDCVLATAYEAFDFGFFTYVIEECVQSSSGNELHNKAIDLLRHVGLSNNVKSKN